MTSVPAPHPQSHPTNSAPKAEKKSQVQPPVQEKQTSHIQPAPKKPAEAAKKNAKADTKEEAPATQPTNPKQPGPKADQKTAPVKKQNAPARVTKSKQKANDSDEEVFKDLLNAPKINPKLGAAPKPKEDDVFQVKYLESSDEENVNGSFNMESGEEADGIQADQVDDNFLDSCDARDLQESSVDEQP